VRPLYQKCLSRYAHQMVLKEADEAKSTGMELLRSGAGLIHVHHPALLHDSNCRGRRCEYVCKSKSPYTHTLQAFSRSRMEKVRNWIRCCTRGTPLTPLGRVSNCTSRTMPILAALITQSGKCSHELLLLSLFKSDCTDLMWGSSSPDVIKGKLVTAGTSLFWVMST